MDDSELAALLAGLAAAERLPLENPARQAVERAAAALNASAKKRRRLERRREKSARAKELITRTGRWSSSSALPGTVLEVHSEPGAMDNDRTCYVCKAPYRQMDRHYHALCPPCATENWAKRFARADLVGRRAIVTGGRIKIGFHLASMLLRDGAHVTVTTRFPRDAARRFARLPDAGSWAGRLCIVGLDLRLLPDVLAWAEHWSEMVEPFDIVVHNAAQTVWRPPAYYRTWAEGERAPLDALAASFLSRSTKGLSPRGHDDGAAAMTTIAAMTDLVAAETRTCPAACDEEGLPLDLRTMNSWRLRLEDVSPSELVETHVVNVLAPFVMTSRLLPSLRRSRWSNRYIVNVSAVEGQFGCAFKGPWHPHTNMAKAAMNMLTRTSADVLARDGIFMTSVDTGWVTDEAPAPLRAAKRAAGFCPPLDVVDGAARVYDPIVRGIGGERLYGVFLKDYRPAPW